MEKGKLKPCKFLPEANCADRAYNETGACLFAADHCSKRTAPEERRETGAGRKP